MVQDIEKLGPKLRIEPIRDPLDVVVLKERKVEVQ